MLNICLNLFQDQKIDKSKLGYFAWNRNDNKVFKKKQLKIYFFCCKYEKALSNFEDIYLKWKFNKK